MTPFELQKTLDSMVLLVDSREKPTAEAKKRWESFGVPYRIQALKSGDYTAEFILPNGETFSLENHAVIERKLGLSEICGNFCQNRDRFIREFERIKEAGARVYIVIENGSWAPAAARLMRAKLEEMKDLRVCGTVVSLRSALGPANEAQMEALSAELCAK